MKQTTFASLSFDKKQQARRERLLAEMEAVAPSEVPDETITLRFQHPLEGSNGMDTPPDATLVARVEALTNHSSRRGPDFFDVLPNKPIVSFFRIKRSNNTDFIYPHHELS